MYPTFFLPTLIQYLLGSSFSSLDLFFFFTKRVENGFGMKPGENCLTGRLKEYRKDDI